MGWIDRLLPAEHGEPRETDRPVANAGTEEVEKARALGRIVTPDDGLKRAGEEFLNDVDSLVSTMALEAVGGDGHQDRPVVDEEEGGGLLLPLRRRGRMF